MKIVCTCKKNVFNKCLLSPYIGMKIKHVTQILHK